MPDWAELQDELSAIALEQRGDHIAEKPGLTAVRSKPRQAIVRVCCPPPERLRFACRHVPDPICTIHRSGNLGLGPDPFVRTKRTESDSPRFPHFRPTGGSLPSACGAAATLPLRLWWPSVLHGRGCGPRHTGHVEV